MKNGEMSGAHLQQAGHRLELGQKVSVVTERVDRFKRQIDFRLND